MNNEFNDASAYMTSPISVGDVATRENAMAGASLNHVSYQAGLKIAQTYDVQGKLLCKCPECDKNFSIPCGEPSLSPDVVERVARAICECKLPKGVFDSFEGEYPKSEYRKWAKAAITAMREGM